MKVKTIQLNIKGMTCDHCAQTIEGALRVKGILKKSVLFKTHQAQISFDEDLISERKIINRIKALGPYRVKQRQEILQKDGCKKHLLILGGGSAAFAAAIRAKELGVKVTMINDGLPIGGTCVNVGCVPSKNLIRAAEALYRAQIARFEGIETDGRLSDFTKVIAQKRELVKTLRKEKYENVVKDMADFVYINGRAILTSAKTVKVNKQEISADALLVATGATAAVPPIPGLQEAGYLTNETAFELDELPEQLVILGANYIGLENAQLFSRLGSKVTVLEWKPQILPSETPDVAAEIRRHLEKEGITFYTATRTLRIWKEGSETILRLSVKGTESVLRASHLIIAAGRKANTANIGLESAGVVLDQYGFVKVDSFFKTNVEGVYRAGDVIGGSMFVYTAAYEGELAASNAFSAIGRKADYTALPWVVFTDPQVAGVGLDEVQAKAKGLDVESATLELSHVPRALAARNTKGFIKLIRDKATDRLIGARIVAPEGAELLMEAALAIKFGITVEQLKEAFHPYLTLSEGIKLAAITFSKNVTELSCCAT